VVKGMPKWSGFVFDVIDRAYADHEVTSTTIIFLSAHPTQSTPYR
jgi:hypothetical protein